MDPVRDSCTSTLMRGECESEVPIGTLPVEMLVDVFSYLKTLGDQASCALTCRRWNIVAHSSTLSYRKRKKLLRALEKRGQYIGPEALNRCIGEIGKFPLLTDEIFAELESRCPEKKGKKKKKTHILALIPKRINGKLLTLSALSEFVKRPKEGNKTQLYIDEEIKKIYGEYALDESSWVLMTKNALKGSRSKSRVEQLKMASEHGNGYRAPILLEAAFINAMLYVRYGVKVFSDDYWAYSFCRVELIDGLKFILSGFALTGLNICYRNDEDSVGVVALKKFGAPLSEDFWPLACS